MSEEAFPYVSPYAPVAEPAAAPDSFELDAPDEVAPEPEAAPAAPQADYEPLEEPVVDTSTLPVALRPCPAGPAPLNLEGRA